MEVPSEWAVLWFIDRTYVSKNGIYTADSTYKFITIHAHLSSVTLENCFIKSPFHPWPNVIPESPHSQEGCENICSQNVLDGGAFPLLAHPAY